MKEAWEKPKLVVLVRGKPEENLIINCKHWQVNPEGPNASVTACTGGTAACTECITYTES